MIDAEGLPSIELACRLRNRTYSDAYRITDDSERRFLLNFAKVTLEYAEQSARIKHLLEKIKKEPADAATRQQACTE